MRRSSCRPAALLWPLPAPENGLSEGCQWQLEAGLKRGKEGLSSWEASGKPCLPLPVTASGSADLLCSAGARQVAD